MVSSYTNSLSFSLVPCSQWGLTLLQLLNCHIEHIPGSWPLPTPASCSRNIGDHLCPSYPDEDCDSGRSYVCVCTCYILKNAYTYCTYVFTSGYLYLLYVNNQINQCKFKILEIIRKQSSKIPIKLEIKP